MRITLSALFLLLLTFACSKKAETESDVEWPEMDSFHMIMAEAFHPLKDSANLQPAKASAEVMAAEADKWSQASLPEKVNNDDVKAMLADLKAGTRDFADQVKANASDSTLTASMTELHNKFHKITEAWYGGGEHKHH